MSVITISSPSYATNGKSGIMVPDDTGYYDAAMGGLNTHNSKGEFYIANNVERLFGAASKLNERARKRELFAEIGHPTPRQGESPAAFLSRAMGINDSNTCSHIREVTLDLDFGKNNPGKAEPNAILISGKVKPAGPHAKVVQDAIDNKYQQLAYSIRCITNVYKERGKIFKEVVTPVTFDWVTSPGIGFAVKENSLSLESACQEVHPDYLVNVDIMKEVLADSMKYIGLESAEYMFKEELLEALSKTKEIQRKDRKIFLFK